MAVIGQSLQSVLGGGIRFARPIVSYGGGDVSAQALGSLQELSYKEGTEQTGDTVEMKLADPEGLIRMSWSLKSATAITLALESENWNYIGERTYRDCGSFQVNRISIRQDKHSGSIVSISATSIPVSSNSRLEKKNKAWTNTTLQAMAQQIASDNGLSLQFQTQENPKIARSDQHDESDFVLLDRHCQENDLFLKVKSGALWVISKEQMENQTPVGTIICPKLDSPGGINGGGVENWEISESTEDTYKGAKVSWRNNRTGQTVTGQTIDPKAVVGAMLHDKYIPHPEDLIPTQGKAPLFATIQSIVQDILPKQTPWPTTVLPSPIPIAETDAGMNARAKRVARSKLKKKNRKGKKHQMTIPLNLRVEAGTVYTLQGFSPDFDGPWLVTEVEHKFAAKGGATTVLNMQMSIQGY